MKEAQQLMRHSTVELTAKVYTHLGITDTAGALQRVVLPTLDISAATGTDDAAIGEKEKWHHQWHQNSRVLTHNDALRCSEAMAESNDANIVKTTMDGMKTAMDGGENNKAGDGIRTHDVQLGKLAFYH